MLTSHHEVTSIHDEGPIDWGGTLQRIPAISRARLSESRVKLAHHEFSRLSGDLNLQPTNMILKQ